MCTSVNRGRNILNVIQSAKWQTREERGAYRAAAVENAAAAILVGGKAKDYAEAVALACESIDSGRAVEKLEKMIEASKIS